MAYNLKLISQVTDIATLRQIELTAKRRIKTLYRRQFAKKLHEARTMAAALGIEFDQAVKTSK